MSDEEFKNLYCKFTGDSKEIKYHHQIITNGIELKEFLEFSIKRLKLK